jgi:hypothetical protein
MCPAAWRLFKKKKTSLHQRMTYGSKTSLLDLNVLFEKKLECGTMVLIFAFCGRTSNLEVSRPAWSYVSLHFSFHFHTTTDTGTNLQIRIDPPYVCVSGVIFKHYSHHQLCFGKSERVAASGMSLYFV